MFNSGYTFETEGLDLDGNWRVCGDRIDIGAYEYSAVGINEMAHEKPQMRIVGNPITEASYAEIEFLKASDVMAKVYSIDGKLLVDRNLGFSHVGPNRIDLGELFEPLAKGAYLLVVQEGGQTFSAKVIR